MLTNRVPECFRAFVRLGHIGDVGTRDRDIPTRQPVYDPGGKQHSQTLGDREHRKADYRADETEDQDRTPPESIGKCTKHGCGNELRKGESGEEETDNDGGRSERLRVERQQRNDDAEADEIDEDREEDNEQRTRHAPTIIC